MNTFGLVLCMAVCLCFLQPTTAKCRWGCWWCFGGRRCCGLRCTWGKREVVPSGLPCKFSDYDIDNDGYITKKELRKVLKDNVQANQIKAIFYIMDIRPLDEKVDENEFEAGPLYQVNC